jgi:hypothetical protein
MNNNSPFLFRQSLEHVIELKAKATAMQLHGIEVPTHMKLPNLQEILKMRPSPTPHTQEDDGTGLENNMRTFLFIAEHLVPAVLEKKHGTGTSVVNGFPQNLHPPTKHTSMSS